MVTARNLLLRLKLRLAMGEGPSPDAVYLPRLDWVQNRDQQAFLRAIEENPNDDAPRLIYADWLEENGNPTAAARLRWFAQTLHDLESPQVQQQLVYEGARRSSSTANPEGIRQGMLSGLLSKHGVDGLDAYNALLNRLLHRVQPVPWDSVRSAAYMNSDMDALRKNLGGVNLANELMALGALHPSFSRVVERQGQTNLNDIARLLPNPGRMGATAQAGHILALHNMAQAGATQAYNIENLSGAREDMAYPSSIAIRRAGNNAAGLHAENVGGALVPQVFNNTVREHTHMATGLALHPNWESFPHEDVPEEPEHLSREPLLRRFVRTALKFAAGEDVPMAESFTPLEQQKLQGFATSRHAGPMEEYKKNIEGIHDESAKPFSNTMPHVRTLTTLAKVGEPAKGEYEATANAIKDLFAHDPEGVTAWMGLNGVFSPQTAYKHHAGAASMLTAAWLNAKKPRDAETIKRLIEAVDAFGKHYDTELVKKKWELDPETGKYVGIVPGEDQTFGGTMRSKNNVAAAVHVLQNTEPLWEALSDPTGQGGQNLDMLGGGGISKVPNFVLSYFHPMFGTAIDTHMARLVMHPDLDSFERHSDILRQVRAHLPPADQKEMSKLEKQSLKGVPVKSELVRMLMKVPQLSVKTGGSGAKAQLTVSNWLKDIGYRLVAKPQNYLAYKYAINEAAKKLGWKPAEVQESVWTALLGLMAANSVGIPHKEIQQHLTADALRKGWQNHESIYFPKLVDTLLRSGANPATLRKLGKRLNQRAAESSRPGILRSGDAADLPDIAAHVPGVAGPGHAAGPIANALRQRLAEYGLLDPTTGKYRLRREGEPLQLAGRIMSDLESLLHSTHAMGQDQAPHLILSDYLMDRGMMSHAGHIAMHTQQNSNRPTRQLNQSSIRSMLHDPSGYGDLVRFLSLHPGRFVARHELYSPREVLLATALPVARTPKTGRVVKSAWPQLTQYPVTFPTVEEASQHHENLIREGAIGLVHGENRFKEEEVEGNPYRGYGVMNWPERGVGETGKQLQRQGQPLYLMAKYDRPLDFGPSLDRITASNQAPLVEGLKQALLNSGINPQHIAPAIHDFGGMTRASILAIGRASNPNARTTAAAWTGLLGRQPGMLAFKGNPRGKDSVYVFHHHSADIVRNVLQQAGITSRTIVPEQSHFKVYVYDPGNKYRAGMAEALSQLGAQAIEWRGDGKEIGGNQDDMGRSQYRDVINKSEAAQFARITTLEQMLWRAVHKNPKDDAPWGVLADRMDEQGKPAFASLLRALAKRPLTYYPRSTGYKVQSLRREFLHPETDQIAQRPHPWNIQDVIGKVNGVPINASLQHGIPFNNTYLHRHPTMAGVIYARPEELKEFPAFGHVEVTTSHGRPVGEARLPLSEFHQVLGEGTPQGVKGPPRLREMLYKHLQASTEKRMSGEAPPPEPDVRTPQVTMNWR